MGRYKEGGTGGTGTGTVEEVTGAIGNGFEVEIGNDPTVDPEVGVKLNPTLTANTVLQSNANGDGIDEATETGTGSVVKASAPTIDSPVLDTAVSGSAVQDDDAFASPSSTKVASSNSIKNYVDNKVAGLAWKAAVRAATTVAGTLASDFENGDTIDGVVLATGDRILIKNQADQTENGIYIVAVSGAPARSTDANTGAELVQATCLVNEGTVNAETQWTQSTNAPITIGVSNIVFVAVNVGTYSAGNGLSQSGNQFLIDTAITADLSTAQDFTGRKGFAQTKQTVTAMGALALDGALGNIFTKTIAAPSTFTQSNFVAGQCFMLELTGAFTPTWWSGITWVTTGAAAPTQGALTVYGFRCTGTNTFLGYLVGTQ